MNLLESLTVRDLRALVALADLQHFGRASEMLGLSQPSLSAVVKKAENSLGFSVFARTTRSCLVTPEGEIVIRQIRSSLESLAAISTQLGYNSNPLTGQFRLGLLPTLGPYYLPHTLHLIRDEFPEAKMILCEGPTESLVEKLNNRELDAALVCIAGPKPGFEVIPLFYEPFVLAIPHDHPLAQKEKVSVQDLNPKELIVMERGNCLRDQTLEVCGIRATSVNPIHATSIESLQQMVAFGLGNALIPIMTAERSSPHHGHLKFVPFEEPVPGRVVGLAAPSGTPTTHDALALGKLLRNRLPNIQFLGNTLKPV